jgi:hypothetical protein
MLKIISDIFLPIAAIDIRNISGHVRPANSPVDARVRLGTKTALPTPDGNYPASELSADRAYHAAIAARQIVRGKILMSPEVLCEPRRDRATEFHAANIANTVSA